MAIGMISAATTPVGAPTIASPLPPDVAATPQQESPATGPQYPAFATPASRDEKAVHEAVQTINENLVKPPLEAQYSVNEKAGLTIIKIVNMDSGEVLRQIPSEKAVLLAEAITARLTEELHLVDEKA